MRALVTGATGCLGRNLVERLIEDGKGVVATGRNARVGTALSSRGAAFVRADIADREAVAAAARGVDVVFHCAALAAPWGSPEEFRRVNVDGTASAVDAAISAGAAMVHVSTPSIYFDFRDRLDIDEYDDLPARQVNEYARTKLLAEAVVDLAVETRGLRAVTIRPRAIFGPHDTALFPRVIAASRGGRVPLVGRGHVLADVTCVSNVVDAMLLAAGKADSLAGRKYNITNGTPILVHDLLAMAFHGMGLEFRPRRLPYPAAYCAASMMELAACITRKEPRLTRYSAGVLRYHQTLSIRRARAELGYTPRKSTAAGVGEYARWRRGP